MGIKCVLGGLALAATLASAPASAAIMFSGSTAGCFGASCTPSGTGASDSKLVFTDATFSNIPAGAVTLGSFSLANGANDYAGDIFDLKVSFTLPVGTGSNTFIADLGGTVTGNHGGPVTIMFTDSPETFNYTGGSFTLAVGNLSIPVGSSLNLTGTLTSIAAVPEPSTWAMMILGFCGLGFMAYRRKQSGTAFVAA